MKNLLIISGNSSIGINIIKKFLSCNYKVFSTYHKSKIKITNKKLIKIELDIKNQQHKDRLKKKISRVKFDYVIFCTGKIFGKNLNQYSILEAKEIFEINLIHPIEIFKDISNKIKKNGIVVFLSSISSEQGSYDPYYASSKASLNMMIKVLSKQYARKMRIITLSPSLVKNTKMYFDMTKKNRLKHIKKNPQNSLINKEDLAKILLDLEKKYWKKLNGVNLNINGGL